MAGSIGSVIHQIISLVPFWFIAAWGLTVTVAFTLFRAYKDPLSKIPGPIFSRWTGVVETSYQVRGHRHDYVHSLHQKYGPIVRYAPGHIDVSDIDAVLIIHKVNKGYRKSDWYHSLAPPGVETLMNLTNPTVHTRWRRLLGGPFQDNYLQKLESVVAEKMATALSKMEEELEERGYIDVLKWWIYMALDVITELSYGASVNILEDEEENRYIMDYLEGLGPIHAVRTTMPFVITIANWLRFPIFNKLLNAGPRAAVWAVETIKAYKKLLTEENPKPTLFTPLFDKGDKGFTDTQITHLAGSNITAVRDKLVGEISQLPEGFKHNDVQNLPYLNCVIQESVRLYAAVPSVLPRAVPEGGVEISGYFIPEGTTISTQCYSLHRREDYFPNALQFDPERWVNPTKEMEEAYMGFGAGTRSCVGTNLAHTELRLGAANFFRKFPKARVSTKEGMNDDDMRQRAWVFTSPVGHRCLIDP
ncbi:Cytochrome P450 [Penicillium expansum]|uniref:Cytochrome P450 n=1 Tax=Penicillium expansum TaxID=27334 RepID=A0A0A2J151_PENEN|nr:Cytochrome P450 [Penicillium expansum]KGO48438.1 Cytochrome P450 [Penicillium expansum]KGO55257.1 Cytochrome P450 [Penicillium expansum]